MKTKTCGECFFYNPKITRNGCGMCTTGHFKGFYVDPTMKVCPWACTENVKKKPKPKPTNGDVIRQMSNRELAEFLDCPYEDCIHKFMDMECADCILDWLNAPAESCVKQNGNDNTQADLSKADHTESEAKISEKPTLFDRITVNEETLATNFVYHITSFLEGLDKPKKIWYSTIIHGQYFKSEIEAKRATVAKLKEVENAE